MLLLEPDERAALWRQLIEGIEAYLKGVSAWRVCPEMDPAQVRAYLAAADFDRPMPPRQALQFVLDGLWRFQTHTPHPNYYGLFNPAPTTMSIAGDALAAAFNPQLAAWSHSPFANEVERLLVGAFAARFGYAAASADGVFCSGGAEANHTALMLGLAAAFPDYLERGARALAREPVFYVSSESHHSLLKAARVSGLGLQAVREIPADDALRMDVAALREAVAADRRLGRAPFLVAATAGTTNAGVVDPLPELARVAAEENLWFHVDAAWGGAAILSPKLRHVLAGIECADSITFDAHKWLSVPMGAGLCLTRHPGLLERTFAIVTDYMPRDAAGLDVADPHKRSLQWSRRAIGLKVFCSLLAAGWSGYREAIEHQAAMGDLLRQKLTAEGWEVINQTPLPTLCFVDARHREGRAASYLDAVARHVVLSGKAWISTTRLRRVTPALRACITNFRTTPADLDTLVAALGAARDSLRN